MNRFATDFLNTTAQALELVRRVNSPAFGIHLDTFHMNIEERNLPAAILDASDKLYHFHVADNDRGTPGRGSLDWHGIRDALERIGYDRAIVIESFMPNVTIGGSVASVWRPLAESGEALASNGVQYLKALFRR